jgi:hypothetical protein
VDGVPFPHRSSALALLLAAGCASTPPEPSRAEIRGLVSFQADGTAQFVECSSGERIRLEGMGQGHLMSFRRHVTQLAARTKQPVTAHVSGYLTRSEDGAVMEQPSVLSLSSGRCTAKDAGLYDY